MYLPSGNSNPPPLVYAYSITYVFTRVAHADPAAREPGIKWVVKIGSRLLYRPSYFSHHVFLFPSLSFPLNPTVAPLPAHTVLRLSHPPRASSRWEHSRQGVADD